MNRIRNCHLTPQNSRGAALMVGLILLLCLTILGVAGMNASRLELIMSGNSQFYSSAKAAALSLTDINMDQANVQIGADVPATAFTNGANAASGTYSSRLKGTGPVPGGGFSLGGVFSAQHIEFTVQVDRTGRNVNVEATQGAYLVGPGNGT